MKAFSHLFLTSCGSGTLGAESASFSLAGWSGGGTTDVAAAEGWDLARLAARQELGMRTGRNTVEVEETGGGGGGGDGKGAAGALGGGGET